MQCSLDGGLGCDSPWSDLYNRTESIVKNVLSTSKSAINVAHQVSEAGKQLRHSTRFVVEMKNVSIRAVYGQEIAGAIGSDGNYRR